MRIFYTFNTPVTQCQPLPRQSIRYLHSVDAILLSQLFVLPRSTAPQENDTKTRLYYQTFKVLRTLKYEPCLLTYGHTASCICTLLSPILIQDQAVLKVKQPY